MRFKYFVVLDLNFKTCVPRTQITGNFHIFYDKLSTVLKKNIPLIINSWNQHSDVDAALICCCKARAKQKSEAVDLLVHLRSCPHMRSEQWLKEWGRRYKYWKLLSFKRCLGSPWDTVRSSEGLWVELLLLHIKRSQFRHLTWCLLDTSQ